MRTQTGSSAIAARTWPATMGLRAGFLTALLALVATSSAHSALARNVCADRHCGGEDAIAVLPPIPPPSEQGNLPPTRLHHRAVPARLRQLDGHVLECAESHLEVRPRTLRVRIVIQPDGAWAIAFGTSAPSGREARGTTPFEVCVADWVAGELGPQLESFAGRRPRVVERRFRMTRPAARHASRIDD